MVDATLIRSRSSDGGRHCGPARDVGSIAFFVGAALGVLKFVFYVLLLGVGGVLAREP